MLSRVCMRTGPAATLCGFWNGAPNACYVTGNAFTQEAEQVTCGKCIDAMAGVVVAVLLPCTHPDIDRSRFDPNDLLICNRCGDLVVVP